MATSNYADVVEHGDDVNSRAEANQAVIGQGMALRVQPPAPAPTKFYFTDGAGRWVRQKCGHSTATVVGAERVRDVVDRNVPKNDAPGGGGVRAVDMDDVGRYA